MQVILDSSFARPGSAPIWGEKKGEFRDWTSTDHDILRFYVFHDNINAKENVFFQSASCKRHCATH